MQRQVQREDASFPKLTSDRNRSPHGVGNLFCQWQPETGAVNLGFGDFGGTIERLENVAQIFGSNSNSPVGDG